MPEYNRSYVDARRWLYLVDQPQAPLMGRRAQDVSQRLEQSLVAHGIGLDSRTVPYFHMYDGQVIDRMVARGWLGLAEGYMLGEWTADPLPDVLSALLDQPLEGKLGRVFARRAAKQRAKGTVPGTGELPEGLVELYAGATRATGAAQFSSSSRTTATETIEVPVAQGSRKTVPATVDFTWFGEPDGADRLDLDDCQMRRIEGMLTEASVGRGDRVLELPSTGGQLAIQAALRGASVDILCSDEDHALAVEARVRAAGVGGAIQIEVIDQPIPSPRQWSGRYHAVFSVERMETLGTAGLRQYLRAVDRMLAADGVAVIQTVVATESMRETARESLDVMRSYVWPALEYPTVEAVRTTVAGHTGLRVAAENYMGAHLAATIPLWRANFMARERQAAAAGFDQVFRRLWDYQLALHDALVAGGDIDCVQFVLRPRR